MNTRPSPKPLFKLVLISFFLCMISLKGQEVYLDLNGIVVMEIESTPVFGGWKMDNSIPGYLGDGYYYWGGNFTTQPGIHTLEYHFKLEKAGTYRVALRNHNSNPDVTLDNDVFLAIDDGTFHKLYSHGGPTWSFSSTLEVGSQHVTPDYALASGNHVLKLSARSADFRLDRIHIWDTSRWSAEEARNIYHSPSPVESGSGNIEAAARIFISSRTNRIPFTVDCDGSLSNGADNHEVIQYSWYDGENQQQSVTSSPLKTFTFFTPGDHTIHLKITDADGNVASREVTLSGTPRTLGSIAPASVFASNTFANRNAFRTIDEDLETSWTTPKSGEYIQYDFVREVSLDSIKVFFKGKETNTYILDILASLDGESFTLLIEDAQTSSNADEFDVISLNENRLRYLRLLVKDTSSPGFVDLNEVVFDGSYAPVSPLEAWLKTAIDYGDGVFGLPWFGYFWPEETGWLYHLQHGWAFAMGSSTEDLWLWQDTLGWTWTSSGMYPFLYVFDKEAWYWFYEDTSVPSRWFYSLKDGEWIEVEG